MFLAADLVPRKGLGRVPHSTPHSATGHFRPHFPRREPGLAEPSVRGSRTRARLPGSVPWWELCGRGDWGPPCPSPSL